jgi:PST family polysaccharide transporter
MEDLRERAIRGGLARILAQAANFSIRLGSLGVLAHLLTPQDFGLVGMVTAVTGFLNVFRDFGLSAASIQRATVTQEQMSTLFWVNVLFGGALAAIALALAPLIARFYHQPDLVWVTGVIAIGFLFNGMGVQHSSLLQRQMRFQELALIDIVSLIVGTAVAIPMAKFGYGYWALVAMTVSLPITGTLGYWIASSWVPGLPRKRVGMRSMMRFGGATTLNGLVSYVAYNVEKVLLGRYWGAEAIGNYGRAYQLISIPTDNLNSAVGQVAFSALSRLQAEPEKLKKYFLQGYSLVLAMTVPVTIGCALYADALVYVLLGPKWNDVVEVFRLLAPTILVFAASRPLGWLLDSLGLVERGLKIALVSAPLMVVGCLIGLPYGPKGVALAYSVVMTLRVVPIIAWAVHGTPISVREVLRAFGLPLGACVIAAALTSALQLTYEAALTPLPRLLLSSTILVVTYTTVLLLAAGRNSVYERTFRQLTRRSIA